MEYALLLTLAGAFAVVNGANDGGAIVAAGLRVPALRPGVVALMLIAGLLAMPVVFGTQVATTLSSRLVSFEGAAGPTTLVVALAATLIVVATLTRMGLPTSLTLSLIGAVVGAGAGAGLPVDWPIVGGVLLLGLAAPLVGALASFALRRVRWRARDGVGLNRGIAWLHRVGVALQCVAYGANDGQKMLAVFAVAAGTTGVVTPDTTHLAIIGVCFALGLLLGLPRVARTLSGKVLNARPWDAVSAEWAAAGAVIATAGVGAPVSMTQALAGGLVGSGMGTSRVRVRWRTVAGIGAAWALTLPTSALLAAASAAALRTSGVGL